MTPSTLNAMMVIYPADFLKSQIYLFTLIIFQTQFVMRRLLDSIQKRNPIFLSVPLQTDTFPCFCKQHTALINPFLLNTKKGTARETIHPLRRLQAALRDHAVLMLRSNQFASDAPVDACG